MTAGEVANPRPEPRPSFTGNLKEQFRALARAIMAPAEIRKKKRADQTRGGLMITASRFMRHILRRQFHNAKADLAREIIPEAAAVPTVPDYAAATAYLSDTLDWLNLWEENGSDFEADEFQPARADHLYPHL